MFNENLFYNSNELNLTAILRQSIDQIIELMNISHDSELLFLIENLDLNSDLNDSDIDLQELADEQLNHETEQTENMPSSNTLSSDAMSTPESTNSYLSMLSTSEKTPELISSETLESDPLLANEKKIPTRSIIGDLSEANIVSGPRQ